MDRTIGVVPTPDQLANRKTPTTPRLMGYKAWTFDPAATFQGFALVVGMPWHGLAEMIEGDTVTNVHFAVSAAGTGLATTSRVGIYQNGRLLAQSGSAQTAFQSTGYKTLPLASPVYVAQGGFTIAFLPVGGSQPPSLFASVADSGGVAITNSAPVGMRGFFDAGNTGQTTLPANVANPSAGQLFWVGVS